MVDHLWSPPPPLFGRNTIRRSSVDCLLHMVGRSVARSHHGPISLAEKRGGCPRHFGWLVGWLGRLGPSFFPKSLRLGLIGSLN